MRPALGRLRPGIAAIDGVHELALWPADHPRVGIVSFVVEGRSAREVAEALSAEHGIGVRDGKFCAHPFVRHLLGSGHGGCDDSGGAVRASIGIGSTDETSIGCWPRCAPVRDRSRVGA